MDKLHSIFNRSQSSDDWSSQWVPLFMCNDYVSFILECSRNGVSSVNNDSLAGGEYDESLKFIFPQILQYALKTNFSPIKVSDSEFL